MILRRIFNPNKTLLLLMLLTVSTVPAYSAIEIKEGEGWSSVLALDQEEADELPESSGAEPARKGGAGYTDGGGQQKIFTRQDAPQRTTDPPSFDQDPLAAPPTPPSPEEIKTVIVKFKEDVGADRIAQVLEFVPLENTRKLFRPYEKISQAVQDKREIRKRRADPGIPVPDLSKIYKIRLETHEEAQNILEELRRNPDVEYAELDAIGSLAFTPNDEYFSYQQSLEATGVPEAWEYETGSQDIVVAVLDSGVDIHHPDLCMHLIAPVDIAESDVNTNGQIDPLEPIAYNAQDDQGHGTAVAGIISAHTHLVGEEGIAGSSWHSKIMPIRITMPLENGPAGWAFSLTSWAAEGVYYAVEHGADVINLSWGTLTGTPFLHNAVQYAAAQGCIVVAAMHNFSNSIPVYPAAYPEVIAVGASDLQGNRLDYSNYGPHLDVVAPAVGMLTTHWAQSSPPYAGEFYGGFGGTSGAAPQVAALAALLLANSRTPLSVQQVRQIIQSTATDTNPPGFDIYTGYGMINFEAALESIQPNYAEGESYAFVRSTMCQNVQSSSPWNPVGDMTYHEYFSLGDRVTAWAHFQNIHDPMRVRWQWYKPDGALHGTYTSDWVPDPGTSGYDYWNWWKLWSWIDFPQGTSLEYVGKWVVKIYVQEGSDSSAWDYISSHTFTLNDTFTLVRSTLAEGVDAHDYFNPVNESSEFELTNGGSVAAWVHLAQVYKDVGIRFRWKTPSGSTFSTFDIDIPHPGTSDHTWWFWYKVWNDNVILPGIGGPWTCEIYSRRASTGGNFLLMDSWTLHMHDTLAPTASVTSHEDGMHVQETTLTLSGEAYDISGINWVTVNGNLATTGDQFQHWTYAAELSSGENILLVAAGDSQGNIRSIADQLTLVVNPVLIDADLYVDDDAAGNPVQDGTLEHPFDSIQQAIDLAAQGRTVYVLPGIYYGVVNMKDRVDVIGAGAGLARIAASHFDGAVLFSNYVGNNYLPVNARISGFTITNSSGRGIVVRKSTVEISNNVITGCTAEAIGNYVIGGHLNIINNTIVHNGAGIKSFLNDIDIHNNIIANNNLPTEENYGVKILGNVQLSNIAYNNVFNNAGGAYVTGSNNTAFTPQPGTGEISADPLFADGAFHLATGSPSIDAGDQVLGALLEPAPNGYRINQGAYGNTPEAQISTLPQAPADLSGNFSADSSTIRLTWTDHAADEAGYLLLRWEASEGLTHVFFPAGITIFTDAYAFQPGKTYAYALLAHNGSGLSEPSNFILVSIPEPAQ